MIVTNSFIIHKDVAQDYLISLLNIVMFHPSTLYIIKFLISLMKSQPKKNESYRRNSFYLKSISATFKTIFLNALLSILGDQIQEFILSYLNTLAIISMIYDYKHILLFTETKQPKIKIFDNFLFFEFFL
jgi:hypothetical protein